MRRDFDFESDLQESIYENESVFEESYEQEFVRIPVERPGGGRIRDKTPPKIIDLVTFRGVGGKNIQLHKYAARAWKALVAAARATGIKHPLLLVVSGYRSRERQLELWKAALARYQSPQIARRWVAPPKGSVHQTGRAIDFFLGGTNSSKNAENLRRLPAYKWLLANARRFGFYPYPPEPWHWEYNPPSPKQKQFESGLPFEEIYEDEGFNFESQGETVEII